MMMYKTYNIVQKGVNYIQNEFPEFRYEDGKINVEAENEIIIPEDKSILGKIMVDTKTEDEQKINQKQSDTHADTDVCHIEHRKIDQTEIKEIYYIIQPDPVNHISHSPCHDCRKQDMNGTELLFLRQLKQEKQDNCQKYHTDKQNKKFLVLQHSKGRASVFQII